MCVFNFKTIIIVGSGKPWLDTGLYHDLWTPYQSVECSGHGQCDRNGDIWLCKCHNSFSGLLCDQ